MILRWTTPLWVAWLILALPWTCQRQGSLEAGTGSEPPTTDARPGIPEPVSSSTTSKTLTGMTSCDFAQEMIRTLDFQQWQGLPRDCDWASFTGPLPVDWEAVPRRPLGSTFRVAHQLHVELEGYLRPSIAFVDGEPVLFEAMGPQLSGLETLKDSLGQPLAMLDWDFGTLPLPGAEYVYPQRGITLFLNSTLDKVLHICLYPSTTLEDYMLHVRPHLGKKPR